MWANMGRDPRSSRQFGLKAKPAPAWAKINNLNLGASHFVTSNQRSYNENKNTKVVKVDPPPQLNCEKEIQEPKVIRSPPTSNFFSTTNQKFFIVRSSNRATSQNKIKSSSSGYAVNLKSSHKGQAPWGQQFSLASNVTPTKKEYYRSQKYMQSIKHWRKPMAEEEYHAFSTSHNSSYTSRTSNDRVSSRRKTYMTRASGGFGVQCNVSRPYGDR
mmetsp:Transcript_36561/g.58664  ORF Transcript_36561/g.58664 Transcript_36561/m.58664 type:complete len:215 (-) Transcript_36561:124-768(-)